MSIYYNPSTNGFYDDDLHEIIPQGSVAISQDQYRALLDVQSSGQQIVAGDDGYPQSITPPAPPLDQAKANAVAECIAYADRLTRTITNKYPVSEVASWPAQEAEAKLVVAGQTPLAPSLLAAMVSAASDPALTLQSLATSVLAKAAAYHQIVAAVQAVRTQAQTMIGAAATSAQIDTILAGLKAKADQLAAQMGIVIQ